MDVTDADRTAEYNAFGPWIDEVRELADVPPLYRGHRIDFAAAWLVLKFPRSIARRDAQPGMDLYDRLVIVLSDRITVLSRDESAEAGAGVGYAEATFELRRIAAVTDYVNLLDGLLTLHPSTGPELLIPYNAASNAKVGELITLLRRLARVQFEPDPDAVRRGRAAAVPGIAPLGYESLGLDDVVFVTASRDLILEEPEVRVFAAHPRRRVEPLGGGFTALLHRIRRADLQGALICGSDSELQIFTRGDQITRGSRTVTSLVRTVLPLEELDSVTSSPHPRYADVAVVTLHAGETALAFDVPAGSDAETVLLAL